VADLAFDLRQRDPTSAGNKMKNINRFCRSFLICELDLLISLLPVVILRLIDSFPPFYLLFPPPDFVKGGCVPFCRSDNRIAILHHFVVLFLSKPLRGVKGGYRR
jgi:hypothetical protein